MLHFMLLGINTVNISTFYQPHF